MILISLEWISSVRLYEHDRTDSELNLSKSLNEQEQKLFRLYGKLPNKKDLLQNKLKVCLPPHQTPLFNF